MKGYHKRNGWLWRCVGGPLDGWDLRVQHSEWPAPEDLPVVSFRLTRASGNYVLHEVEGKTSKYSGETYPKHEYRWTTDDE